MIKGINKQILEVTNVESPYFERIIFFVRPEGQKLPQDTLKSHANKIALTATKPPKSRKGAKQYLMYGLYTALGLGAGCAIAFVLNSIIK